MTGVSLTNSSLTGASPQGSEAPSTSSTSSTSSAFLSSTPTARPSVFSGGTGAYVIIDTSVWVSRLLPHDSNHQAARTWIDNHILNGGFFVAPMIFVLEVASAIARETMPPNNAQADAHKAVRQIYALPIMRLPPSVLDGTKQHEITHDGMYCAPFNFRALLRHPVW